MADPNSGFTGFWDKLLTTPSGGSIIGALRGENFDETPQGQETLRNLYAQGYMGEGNPDAASGGGIVHQRVGLGALLQKLGVLGDAAPVQASPYERYEYGQGSLAHQKEQQGMAKEQQAMHLQGLSAALALAQHGGGIPPGLVSDADMSALGDVGKAFGEKQQREAAHEALYEKYMQAQIDKKEEGADPQKVLDNYIKDFTGNPANKPLIKQHAAAMEDAVVNRATGDPVTDPLKRLASFQRAKHYEDLLLQNSRSLYGSGGLGDTIARQSLGNNPTKPWTQAYNLDPSFEEAISNNPQLQDRIQGQSLDSGGIMGSLKDLITGKAMLPSSIEDIGNQMQQQQGLGQ